MIFFLLNRNRVFKVGMLYALTAPLALLPIRNEDILRSGVLPILWSALTGLALSIRPRELATHFEAGLPIAGRQFLWAKAMALLAVIWLPVATCASLVTARGPAGNLVPQFAEAGALLSLACVLPWSAGTRQALVSLPVFFTFWTAVLFVGAPSVFLLRTPVFLAVCGGATVLTFLRVWLSVPASFQMAPLEATGQGRSTVRAIVRPGGKPAWWAICTSGLPLVGALLFLAGIFAGIVPLFGWWFLALVLFVIFLSRQVTRWLQSLPVSRRALLTLILAMTVVPFIAGAAAGMAIVPALPSPYFSDMVGFGPHVRGTPIDYPNTNVPLEVWRHAPGGNIPAIHAPWGETVQPPALSILGLKFYNPYASGTTTSARFFEWQFGRATEALHARPFSVSKYRQIELGTVMPHTIDQPRFCILTLGGYLFGSLFVWFLHEVALSHSLDRNLYFSRYRLAIFAPLVMPFFVDQYYLSRYSTAVSGPFARMFLRCLSAMLPQNLLAVAAVAVVPSIAMYFLLQRQFAQSEMTNPMQRRAS